MDSTASPPETPPSPPPAAPEPPAAQEPPAARKFWRPRGVWPWLLLLALGTAAVYYYPSFKAQAEAGSAYAARIGCSCRYVQGRDLDSCQRDFEPGMEIVSVADDSATKTVTGSVPLLASRSARFEGASGCVLVAE